MSTILWEPRPDQLNDLPIQRFIAFINERHGTQLKDYAALHRHSVAHRGAFWRDLMDFCEIKLHTEPECELRDEGHMTDAEWFPGARLNFAENLLVRDDDATAIRFEDETGAVRTLSWAELHRQVGAVQQQLIRCGVGIGDRVAAFMPNVPETVVAMLATTALGAIWSSTSPDFGINGVLDRFGQIEPKVLFCCDAYHYNGKVHDCLGKVAQISARIPSIEHTVVVGFVDANADLGAIDNAARWGDWLMPGEEIPPLQFEPLPFDHPLYILYSSGTTGVPKCIVHRAGGILVQHLKELVLHGNVGETSRLFYFTTCGWMMWNWMASTLATGGTLVLYDGSPFYPDGRRLFDLADKHRITHLGSSAKWIAAVEKAGIKPRESHELADLQCIFSTGSPLMPASFDYVYRDIKSDVCLSSISGGTDICSCFALGNPALPVRRGELQCLGLGMDVAVLNDAGERVFEQAGELACMQAFPSMPVYFWNDAGKARYKKAYFSRFENIWCHSDRAEITASGGMIIYGRSDTTLNPQGVRIGTAEIYRQVESLPEIIDSVVVGQDWQDDTRVVLFVVMRDGHALDEAMRLRIKDTIRKNTTPRHVPAVILAVPEVPKTLSGKVVELAVRTVIHGGEVDNTDALANPAALQHFRNRPELAQ